MDMSENDLEHVAALLEQHMKANVDARKAVRHSHWKRRGVLLVVVIVGGTGASIALHSFPILAGCAQSVELILTCAVDSLFSKARNWE